MGGVRGRGVKWGDLELRLLGSVRGVGAHASLFVFDPISSSSPSPGRRRQRWTIVRCLNCGLTKRFLNNPEYKLWAEQPEALLENQPQCGERNGASIQSVKGEREDYSLAGGSRVLGARPIWCGSVSQEAIRDW